MKYLKLFNEASHSAKEYVYRRDFLPTEIENILEGLKLEFLKYSIRFSTDFKKIEIDITPAEKNIIIDKQTVKDTLAHLISFLETEKFELSYYWTPEGKMNSYVGGTDITTPEFKYEEFFDLLPDQPQELYLSFLYNK